MRTMKKHIMGRQNVDYYECTQCGWSYPAFSGSSGVFEGNRPTEEEGRGEFEKHDCDGFPRTLEGANQKPPI
jgi:hypothetical protein